MASGNPSAPFSAAALGVTGETNEPGLIVAIEEPQHAPGFPRVVPKEVLERLHLERFRFNHLARRGEVPFDDVRRGDDPPDFIVTTASGPERLDCAALAINSRRVAHHLFSVLQRRLVEGAEGRSFDGIAGTAVSISFGPHLDELPPRRFDASIVSPLLDALAEATIDRDAHRAMMEDIARSGALPNRLPQDVVGHGSTPDGQASFVANVAYPLDQIPAYLPGELQFALQLHFPHQVTRSQVEAELQRLVANHDKPQIEHLLVSAGAPNQAGILYPAEEILARLLFEGGPPRPVTAAHLKRVSLHLWSTAEVAEMPLA